MAKDIESQMRSDDAALVAFVVFQDAAVFNMFVPDTFKARVEAKNHDVRVSYIPASIFNVAIGVMLSVFVKNWKPFMASVFTTTGLIMLTEYHMRIVKGTKTDAVVTVAEMATHSDPQGGPGTAQNEAVDGTIVGFPGEDLEGAGGVLYAFDGGPNAGRSSK